MKGLFAFGAVAAGAANAAFAPRGFQNTTTTSQELTTSTIYTTSVHTVTSCAPTVPNCPVGHVTTETIVIGTTVCPVSTETSKAPITKPTQYTTSTIYTTSVHTVTHCPPEVVDCPTKPHVTTETIAVSTTVCPVTEVVPPPVTTKIPAPITSKIPPPPPAGNITSTLYSTHTYIITKCPPSVPNCPVGQTTTTIIPTATTCIPQWTSAVKPTTVIVPPPSSGKPAPPPASSGKPAPPPASSQPGSPAVPSKSAPAPPPGQSQSATKPAPPPGQTQPATQPAVTPGKSQPAVVPTGTQKPTPVTSGPVQITNAAARGGVEMVAAAAGIVAFFL